MRKFTLPLLALVLMLPGAGACVLRVPPTSCQAIDTQFDGVIDYIQCNNGCFLYDADGDLLLDDRVCEDPFSGCSSLDIDDDSVFEQSSCDFTPGCSQSDVDGDGLDDDTFCVKTQGCFVVDLNSDGVLEQNNCLSCISWEPADLLLDSGVISDCAGPQFTAFHAGYQLFLGVILCSTTRYKILMSDSAAGPFYNIGDGSGHGQDHCELVNPDFSIPVDDDITSGGCSACNLGSPQGNEGGVGFIRDRFGEGFSFDTSWIPNYFTSGFYECGIALPSVDSSCTPSPECKRIDRDGDGLPDTFDCSALNGCIASDFNQDSSIDSIVCDPGVAP